MKNWRARSAGGARGLGALVLVGLVLLSGCQGRGGQRLEPREDGSGGGTLGGAELGRFMAFVRETQVALRSPKVPEAERRAGEAALLEVLAWLHGRGEEQLAHEEPLEVYLRFKVARVQRSREAEARDRVVEVKLEEYWRWARARRRLARATSPMPTSPSEPGSGTACTDVMPCRSATSPPPVTEKARFDCRNVNSGPVGPATKPELNGPYKPGTEEPRPTSMPRLPPSNPLTNA